MRNTILENEIKNLNETIANNLLTIIEVKGLRKSNICNKLKESGELTIDRTTFSKYINDPTKSMPLPFLKSCCKFFNISLDDLTNENFNPDNLISKSEPLSTYNNLKLRT